MGLLGWFKTKKVDGSEDLETLVRKAYQLAFPGGEAQIEQETEEIKRLIGAKVSHQDAKAILFRSKSLLAIAQDKSEKRIVPGIRQNAAGKLTHEEASAVYRFLIGEADAHTTSGAGSSLNEAVLITATSAIMAVPAQYAWLSSQFGQEGQDYTLGARIHLSDDHGKSYTMHEVILSSGEQRQVFFDVTASMGDSS